MLLSITSLLSHRNLLTTCTPDLSISLVPKLAAHRYLIANLTFHYLIGLCSLLTVTQPLLEASVQPLVSAQPLCHTPEALIHG